jgi:signal transduction histidine kinase
MPLDGSSPPGSAASALSDHIHHGWIDALSELWEAGVVVLNTAGEPDFATHSALKLLGSPSLAELKTRWSSLAPQLQHAFADLVPGNPAPVELVVAVPGTTAELRLHARLHSLSEDECAGYLLSIQRLDRVERVERSLRQSTRFRSLTGLLRGVVHDVKGSLNSLSVQLEALVRIPDLSPEDRARIAMTVHNEIERLDRTVAALLDPGTLETQPRSAIDVRATVDAVATLVAGRARSHQIAVDAQSPASPLWIEGAPDQVHAALLTLVVNALDAMDPGGRLQIVCSRVAGEVRVDVSDTGPGIPTELREQIWRLYYSTKAEGSGIGLHVARTIARAHDGRAELLEQPAPGYATTFRLSFPAR